MEGFQQGVERYNEDNGADVQLLGWDGKDGSFTEDFEDKTKGQSVGEQLIGQGADILFPVAGPAGLGGLQAAKDAGALGIWVDTDGYESTEYGDILLTSVAKGMDVSVTEAIKESLDGHVLQRALRRHARERWCGPCSLPRLRQRDPAGAEGQDRGAQGGHHRRVDHGHAAACELTQQPLDQAVTEPGRGLPPPRLCPIVTLLLTRPMIGVEGQR